MPREVRYLALHRELKDLVSSADYPPGSLLPGEAELAQKFQASRVTVRKALSRLKEEGFVASRQGFGWSVVAAPLRQPLDTLMSIDAQIAAAGGTPERRLLAFAYTPPPGHVAAQLGDDTVLELSRLNLADGEPLGRNTAWAPGRLATDISLADAEAHSLHELLGVELRGATQVITAQGASETDARLLGVVAGSPLLRFERVTYDTAGRAVLVSEAIYNPLRTEFVIDLAAPAGQTAGLRYVAAVSPGQPRADSRVERQRPGARSDAKGRAATRRRAPGAHLATP